MLRVLRPLIERTTWRRWSHLVVGGALLMPYWFLAMSLAPVLRVRDPVVIIVLILIVLPTAATFVTGLVPTVRLLEASLAKELLKGPAAALVPGSAASWESRIRAAAWFTLHLATGVVVSGLSLAVPPFAVVMILAPAVAWDTRFLDSWGWEGTWHQWPAPLIGTASMAVLLALIVVAGALLSRAAPWFLGPSAAERIAAMESEAVKLAERNRLARELHDSVGHALSVVTLQAGAAGRVLDSDPAFAREALGAIEESARAALEDLDHVLGLLRDDPSRPAPQATLKDLDRLLEQTRIAGVTLDAEVDPEVEHVPAAVSREAYRIVQEGLTNALRHAGKVPVRLRLGTDGERLEVEMSNPLGSRRGDGADHGGGRGLGGVRERVTVLRGEMTAGAEGGRWRFRVSLPLRSGT
ncbi:sensor histidine kinase [Actinomadura madurae]|uniref:sensor histidine kinase n=1 Tax=Actinomadura madurae TaxID=1993 RepID=UPI002025DA92|nr:histidine kinase [Actinomadura madurae]MCP9954745.1 histidine kinase [Actinomadura madurae]MCQ0004456.1 histidine kinase [Actinomadura madurae]URN00230.1 histidine kinase [Actinomadura madurae]URN10467.1 histidine kinase [Actinomadura madurae]